MPQMAPINWLFLFIMFSLIFIIFNMMNYFFFFPNMPKSIFKNSNIFSFKWKW